LHLREDGAFFQEFKLAELVQLQAERHRLYLVRTFGARDLDAEFACTIFLLDGGCSAGHSLRRTAGDMVWREVFRTYPGANGAGLRLSSLGFDIGRERHYSK
jgi:hypothetical protein